MGSLALVECAVMVPEGIVIICARVRTSPHQVAVIGAFWSFTAYCLVSLYISECRNSIHIADESLTRCAVDKANNILA